MFRRFKMPLRLLLTMCSLPIILPSSLSADSPRLPALAHENPKTPLVFVPGITGSKMRLRENGEILWGYGSDVFKPRDGGYSVARPLHLPFDDPTSLESFAVIDRLNLGFLVRKEVYGAILDTLTAHGYRRGTIDSPDSPSTLYPFHYDWRLDNIVAVRRLAEALEHIRIARGEEHLEVDLLCQSNGAYICRYLAKYGSASLAEAEAGTARLSPRIVLRKVILLGSANGGSLRNLREIHRGRSYIPMIGRYWQPETLFSCPSLFQDLPAYRDDFFLDREGKPLNIDLFDAESWRQYGWSIFSPEARRRLQKNPQPDLFGGEDTQLEYLRRFLARAKRTQELLRQDTDLGNLRLYSIQSRNNAKTPDRAVLVKQNDGWQLLFPEDAELERIPALARRTAAAGDGHATLVSQNWLSNSERKAMPQGTYYAEGGHFDLVTGLDTLRFLLKILAEPVPSTGE